MQLETSYIPFPVDNTLLMEQRYLLRGEVDLATAPQLRADLDRVVNANRADLTIDCANLSFIDSTGIAVILEARERLENQGRHLRMLNLQSGPRRVLEVLGLTDLFRYHRA